MAVAARSVEALVAGTGAKLTAKITALRQEIVNCRGQSGSSQTGTSAEQTAFDNFKAFIAETDVKVLQPYFYDHADDHDTYYSDGLGGLTQALIEDRLTLLTAYTKALENATDATVLAQGAPACTLLKKYAKASTTKTGARTDLQQTIGKLGPAATAVAEALWDTYTAACYTHRREPRQARQYFDYASLPNRANVKKGASKLG